MKRAFGKILSLILVVSMLIQIIPTAVFATENKEVSLESFSELAQTRQETVEEALSSAQILFEEESLREHNVKHFRMDDGNYIAVQYGTPVHYEDDGEWVDYDNTLYPVNSLDGSGVSCYRVVNGDSTRVFATNADAKYLLAVQKGDYSLAFAPVQEAAVELPIDPNQPIVASTITEEVVSATVLDFASTGDLTDDLLLEQVQPDKLYSALEYSNAMHGADLRYENYGNTIKESIVISAPQAEYTYSFDIETEGLAATLQSDGSVLFTSSDGTIVYYIPAPYMVDANNEYSYEASYTLTGSGSTFTLTVTADASWINAENRAFPVILDPTIVEQDLSDSVMSGGFVRSGYPDSVDPRETGLYVGDNGNNNADTRTYLHVNSLIDLPEGCEMYYAGFAMYHYAHEYKSGGSDLEVGLYGMAKVNGATSSSMTTTQWRTYIAGLTWSDVISSTGSNYHDADHLSDKKTLNTSTVGDYVTWDLTTLAYNWYDGNNLGFALIPINESSASSRATFYGPRKTEYQPMLFLAYKSTVGIESYYTYQSANIGRAGTSYISDYSMQNTLVVPLISSASDVMPFSLSMVYNSAYGARAFTNDDTMLHTKDFSTMKLGTGWKLSAQESVVKITLNDETYLVYTDSDGTEHYFKYDSEIGKYTDEDGLGLYLTISGTNFTMTDDYENTKYFTNGYLTWQKDYYGNYIYYNYNSNDQISTIKRLNKGGSAEALVTFTYDSNNRLTAITDDANRVTSFGYSTIQNTLCLTSIEFPDDVEAEYSYFDSTTFYKKARMKSAYDSEANYGIEYSYSYNKDVRNFYEYYLDGTTPVYGSKQHGYKAAHSQAIYRYYGDDQTAETSDDILTYIVLDSAGRNIGSYSTDYSKQHILGVGAAGYTTNSGTSKKNNRLTASVSAGQQGVNMLKNGNLETGSSSTTVTSWSRSSSTYVKVGTTAYTGDRGAYFSRSTATSTKDRLYQSSITLKANKTYTFSAYIKVPDTVVFSDGGGIYLSLRNSSTEYATSEIIDYSTEKINDGWIRLTTTYTVGDTDLTSIMATVYATYYKGMMYVDALQLEEEDAASTFNMAEEGSFENTTSFATSATSGWYMAGAAQLTTEGGSYFGSKAVALSGSGYQRVSQSIPVNAPLGSTFILSAWAKGAADPDSVEKKTVKSDPYFGLVLRFYFSDDTSEVHYYPFDTYYRGWQYKQAIAVPEKTGSVTIDSITIVVAYDNNINTAYVDNVSFRMEPVQTYTYNSDGKLTATTQMGTGSDSAEYTGVDLTQYTSANNNKYTYTYNDAHDVLTASAGGVTATNSYNASGNVVGSTLKNSAGSLIISTSNTITSDFNHIKSSTDGNGDTTTYTYDSDTEQLTSVKNAKNILTEYEYDSAGRMKKVSQVNQDDASKNDVTVNYIYKNGQIETLGRTTKNSAGRNVYQGYNFESNQWGQNTAINIATSSNGTTWTEAIELISYAYENYAENASGTGGGNLAQTTFGNDDTINYTYDEFDRLIGMVYNSGKYVTYTYNSEGSVAEMEYGNSSGKQGFYRFEYDSLGRLIRSAELDGDDNLVQRTEHIYDSYNRLSSQSWTVGTETYTESYTYSDGENGNGSISHITTATGASVSFAYDTLQRLNKKTVKNGTATIYTSAYSFYTSGATTTTQIEYHNIKDANNNVLTGGRYVYDSLGNIEKIYESVLVGTNTSRRQLAAYEYDAQNQLTKETIYTYAKTNLTSTPTTTTIYEYTYDTAGNILSESKTVGNSTTTKSYTYDNANWKDLLTGVNGMEITYDEIGNPVSYRNGTELYYDFEWENGRELSFVEYYHGDQGRAFYYYDADGIRIKKVLDTPGDCPTVNYVTQNGKVVRETLTERYGTKVLDYIYDDTGKPFALIFTDADSTESTYYYALNLQGDVVGLLNESGALVVKYRYNAWGEILSITDGEDVVITDWYHIAHLNPLRYRGYYYDTETGFYYLQSRYYDPVLHRFINADSAEYSTMSAYSTNDTNLFAYCGNNPVNRADDGGQFWNTIIGAVVGAVVGAVNAAINDEDILAGALIGAGTGAMAGAAVDLAIATGGVAAVAIAAGGGALSSGLNYIGTKTANGKEIKYGELAFEATVGAASNLLSFGVAGGIMKKTAGSVMNNLKKSFTSSLMKNTTRKVAGKVVLKTTKGIVKNVCKNIARDLAMTTVITGGTTLFTQGVERSVQ